MKNIFKTIICIAVFSISVNAGLNPNAVISLDLDPSTIAIDTILTTTTDSAAFSAAVRIDNIVNLKGYSIKFNIDNTKLQFSSFVLTDAYNTNILGSGPMSFTDDTETSVEIVTAISSSVTAAGGYLGTISFKSCIKAGQSIAIAISSAEITDNNNSLDQVSTLKGAAFKIEPVTHSLALRQYSNSNLSCSYADGKLWMGTAGKVNLLDMKGRTLKQFTITNSGYYNLTSLQSGKYLIKINNNISKQNYLITVH